MSFYGANPSKAVVVGGISAIACVSAALYLYKKRRTSKNRGKLRRKSPAVGLKNAKYAAARKKAKAVETKEQSLSSASDTGSDTHDDVVSEVKERKTSKNRSNQKCEIVMIKQKSDEILPNYVNGQGVNGVYDRIESWSEEVERAERDAEERASKLAQEFLSKVNVSDLACTQNNAQLECDGDGEVTKVLMTGSTVIADSIPHRLTSSPKTHCVESPSVGSDGRSEGSQDSGKGASIGLTSTMSPVEEVIEVPPMYEFEVPQDIVGLLIGRKGTTIKWFTDESGAHIVIRHHYYSDKHKICTIEGSREQINKCLRLIRHKFPPSRFPDLKLTPLLPPPIASPHSPVFDSIIHLKLPESVRCEVVLSSLVDAGHFFLQQPTHPTFPSLARLDQYMLAVYNQPAGVPGLPRPIDIGVVCAAPVLGGWYRAQTITCYDETDEVLVKFVDYGGYSKIPAMDLRQIRSDFMTLPFQANECCLAHIKPLDENEGWSSRATTFFEETVHAKVVEALVVGHVQDNISLVELYLTVDNESVTVNRLLVDNGYAQWVEDE